MTKKLNQAQPEGIAQPKIEAHSRWKNNYGEKSLLSAWRSVVRHISATGMTVNAFALNTGSRVNLSTFRRKRRKARRKRKKMGVKKLLSCVHPCR